MTRYGVMELGQRLFRGYRNCHGNSVWQVITIRELRIIPTPHITASQFP